MGDRSDEFRKAAADCITIARTTRDSAMRAGLLTMAQRWYDLANGPAVDFDAVLQEFNSHQMLKPAVQQQPQIPPKKSE